VAVSAILAFWATALVLIATPGPDWAFTLSAGLRGRSVVTAVGGLVIGYALVTTAVAAGVGALVAGAPALLSALTVVGGGYLIWHGATVVARPSPPAVVATAATGWHTLVKGVGVSGLNPKGLLIFLALLPQFTDPGWRWPVAGQIVLLGLTFTLTCAAFYLCVGLLARSALRTRPAAARVLSRVSGVAMIVVGAAGMVVEFTG